MDNRKIKSFSSFIIEDGMPANTVGAGNIAGLPPDLPPVAVPSERRKKSNIVRRKKPKT